MIVSQFYVPSLEESQPSQSLSELLKKWMRELDIKLDIASEWKVKEVAKPNCFIVQQELSFVDCKMIKILRE